MSVDSTNVALFAGVEDLDDMFMTTMEELDKEVSDEVSIAHPLWEYLQRHNLIEYRDSIGTHVPVKLMYKGNNTVKWATGYDDSDNTPQNVNKEAKFEYGHLTGTQMYNREELVKNQGPEQLIDLVSEKQEQLLISLNNEFAETIIGTQDADGRKPMGFGRIMNYDASCGGLDPTVAGNEFWNPQKTEKSAGVNFTLATEMREGIRKMDRETSLSGGGKVIGGDTKKGFGNKPDVLVCGEDLYEEMQSWAEGKLRVTLDEIKDSSGWGDFEMFTVLGRTIIYEPSLTAKVGWALNLRKSVKLRVHRGTNFKFMPWQMLPGKVAAKKRDNLTYVSVYCRSRRANGIITYQ